MGRTWWTVARASAESAAKVEEGCGLMAKFGDPCLGCEKTEADGVTFNWFWRGLHSRYERGTFLQQHQALSRHRNPLRKDRQKFPRRRPPRLRPGLAQMTTGPSVLRVYVAFCSMVC